jgi:hypothetical protein
MRDSNVTRAVAIGWDQRSNGEIAKLAEDRPEFVPVFGAQMKDIGKLIGTVEKDLKEGRCKGFKVFLGYDPIYPTSRILSPIYRFAEKYSVPVIFHTGDTWGPTTDKARVKFAHPLNIDDLAVAHKDMRILIAHSGNPWVDDTAEVIYKNENCYADISGWFLGNIETGYGELMRDKLNYMVQFAGSNKLMFGSDWPLIKIGKYTEFLEKSGLKRRYRENIAYRTAERFWGL